MQYLVLCSEIWKATKIQIRSANLNNPVLIALRTWIGPELACADRSLNSRQVGAEKIKLLHET